VADAQLIAEPSFWHLPLRDRMAQMAEIRELDAFPEITIPNPFNDESLQFFASLRHADVLELSRRPADFCSGKGSTAIVDFPPEINEFFGSFIAMDDPRHARQRGIVARSFTPRQLQGVLDSVELVCDEVIDQMCERGEVDLVQAVAEPFPLLIIIDMMGIPRSEFSTVLRATNVILGAGDPEMVGQEDVFEALIEAGTQLAGLMKELAVYRRANPADDLTTALVHNDVGEDMLSAEELGAFFILLAVAGNDTTRNAITHGMHLLSQSPGQRAAWQADLAGGTTLAVEELIRVASPVTFMRRTATRDLEVSGHRFREGDRVVLFYGAANRDPRVFEDPEKLDLRRDPNPHLGFGGPGPHFCLGAHLARRELAVVLPRLLSRLPDIEVTGEPEMLQSLGIPLVGGIKHLPVRFTPVPPLHRGK
jgi:cytochrome P450